MSFSYDWKKMNSTQKKDLAFRLDLSYSYLCAVAKGHRMPSYVIGLCLERELEKSMVDLFPGQKLRRTHKGFDQKGESTEWEKILHERRLVRAEHANNVETNISSRDTQSKGVI